MAEGAADRSLLAADRSPLSSSPLAARRSPLVLQFSHPRTTFPGADAG
jgi:hypothetical protein